MYHAFMNSLLGNFDAAAKNEVIAFLFD